LRLYQNDQRKSRHRHRRRRPAWIAAKHTVFRRRRTGALKNKVQTKFQFRNNPTEHKKLIAIS
jgi:hypothetical protein